MISPVLVRRTLRSILRREHSEEQIDLVCQLLEQIADHSAARSGVTSEELAAFKEDILMAVSARATAIINRIEEVKTKVAALATADAAQADEDDTAVEAAVSDLEASVAPPAPPAPLPA